MSYTDLGQIPGSGRVVSGPAVDPNAWRSDLNKIASDAVVAIARVPNSERVLSARKDLWTALQRRLLNVALNNAQYSKAQLIILLGGGVPSGSPITGPAASAVADVQMRFNRVRAILGASSIALPGAPAYTVSPGPSVMMTLSPVATAQKASPPPPQTPYVPAKAAETPAAPPPAAPPMHDPGPLPDLTESTEKSSFPDFPEYSVQSEAAPEATVAWPSEATVTWPATVPAGPLGLSWKIWGVGAVVVLVGGYVLMSEKKVTANRRRLTRRRR